LIDFADPNIAFGDKQEEQECPEDDVAEAVVDRKAILREQ